MKLTKKQVKRIDSWLFSDVEAWVKSLEPKTFNSMYWYSYQNWYRGGRGYGCLQQGGTGQMYMRMYYHHVLKVGSNEWRPSIIIRAVLRHLGI